MRTQEEISKIILNKFKSVKRVAFHYGPAMGSITVIPRNKRGRIVNWFVKWRIVRFLNKSSKRVIGMHFRS